MGYEAQELLARPAMARAELWRLALGVLGVVALFLILNQFYFQAIAGVMGDANWTALSQELNGGGTPRSVLFMLSNFGLIIVALAIVLRALHGRSLASLFGNLADAWTCFRSVGLVLLAISVTVIVLPILPGSGKTMAKPLINWLLLLPFGVVAVAIQIAAEELVFRGYLQSQLSARFSHPLIWMGVPSILFALLHYDATAFGDNALMITIWAGFFGLAASDLTARTGNLGAALALHLVNNAGAILIAALPGNWDGLALMRFSFGPGDTEMLRSALLIEGALLLIVWLAARLVLRR